MPETPDWLSGLNPQQLQAVTHGDGPLLIIAGAGTGKTNTLAHRVAWLIHEGVQPGRILLLTFTRRAAQEMLNRARTVGLPEATKVWGGTFHSMANRLLRTYGRVVGLQPEFTVMDESDSADMLGLIRAQMGLTSKEKRFPRKSTIRSIYSRVVNSREPLELVLKKEYPWCVEAEEGLRTIFNTYTKRKHARQVLDYDDLLSFWNLALEDATVAEMMGARFDHILVDEYQDTNVIQAEILQRLRQKNHNITVVGDDAQSIYSFRAATIKNILEFPNQFPGTTVVTLEQNYRSIQPILDVGNAVMKPAPHRYTKNLFAVREGKQKPVLVTCRDEDEQVKVVCDQILEHLEQGIKLQQQAVLFRAGHHSDQLEIELARRNIPFHKYGGLKFLEAAHVKDLLALLRILENPRDDMSWFRVLEMLEGVGPKTAERFVADLEERTYDLAVLGQITMPAAAHDQYQALAQTLLALREEELPVAVQVERLRRFYEPFLTTLYDNPKPRLRDLEQLEAVAQRYKSRSSFISDLTLDPPDTTADFAGPPFKDEDWLVLSTMHSAKGCEWKAVYVIHAADGMIPSDMATGDDDSIEEERRLFYVAVTRAKDWLYVVFPLRYYYKRYPMGDAHAYAQLTRFAPASVQKLMDSRGGGSLEVHDGPPTDEEIRAKIAKYWDRKF
ncbi:MAG: ATP-dependent helicase [candidate division WOR-3 bacterium]|nr:ATP-dependent helicase [candidate division WOR-3 bacterium]